MGICNYVPRYVSLWGSKCQTGVSTGDFAQGVFLFHSKWVSVSWGWICLSQSLWASRWGGVCPGVCLGAGVMQICWGMCPGGEGMLLASVCWGL